MKSAAKLIEFFLWFQFGWKQAFPAWFNCFVDFVKERPLFLLFDGHLTHILIPVIKRTLDENIIIVKFSPHVTDVLQPLAVSCFGPLKHGKEDFIST